MATAPVLVSVEEYLRTSYDPDCDYVDGAIQERNVGETPHSSAQKFFIAFFAQHEKAWGIRVFPEDRVQVSSTRYRVADICLVRRSTPLEKIIRTPPLLCIEVLSAEDRMSRTQDKVDDYIRMGVDAVWVIDPLRRCAWFAEGSSTLQPAAELLAIRGTEIKVVVADIFRELDEMEALLEG